MRSIKTLAIVALLLLFSACSSKPEKVVTVPVVPDASREKPVLTPEQNNQYMQAISFVKSGQFSEAKEAFDSLLTLHAKLTGAYVNLAIISSKQGEVDLAINHLKKALTINPANTDALTQSGILYMKQKEFEQAEEAFLKAVGVDKNIAIAHYNLGVLYELYLQNYERSIHHYQAYIELTNSEDAKTVARWIKLLERKL